MTHRLLSIVVIIALLFILVTPIYAMSNPSILSWGTGLSATYKVFYNVLENDDMLFVAEGYVYYPVTQNYTASEAFSFEVLNTTGNVTYASVMLNNYGDRPISIYLSANQTASLGLTVGASYGIRILGNPLIFASPTGNNLTAYLGAGDYVDQALGNDGGSATNNMLRIFLIGMAEHIEDEDSPPLGYEYITTVQGVRYLTSYGGDIFIEGIPNLQAMCPLLFQSSVAPMKGDSQSSNGTYASMLTPLQRWGANTAKGLENLGIYLGISTELAGSLILFIMVCCLAIYFYKRTQSGVAVTLLVAAAPFLGAWLGLMPMALAFIFTIIIMVLMSYFFYSRGAM